MTVDRRRIILGIVAGGTLAVGGVGWLARTPPPIRIGVLHSTSGTMAISERPLIDAVQLAVEEINGSGGVLGRQIEVVVADGRSDPSVFAAEAERLIAEEDVVALFGCWTSASRKAVKEVVERNDHLLFYPLQYEGLEESQHIVYLGAVPNQQILPALRWSLANLGSRFFLVGSDYLFPRAANAVIKAQLERWPFTIVGEEYVELGSRDVTAAVRGIAEARPDVVINTLNGDTNVAFFAALREAGLTADVVPTLSFSIAEEELRYLPAESAVGHYASWPYFQSVAGGSNERFVSRVRERYGATRVTSDPMESAYTAVHLFAAAAAAAGSVNPAEVRAQVKGRSLSAPGGMLHIDAQNQHAWKVPRIGRMRADGQFDVVWTAGYPVAPTPYPPLRSRADWDGFLDQLQKGWGGRWENPGR